jgi:phosphoribosylformylglycinamidine synthase subunit PurS
LEVNVLAGADGARFSVFVSPKAGVLDPQGQAALHALQSLGYGEVEDVRIGKYIILTLKAGQPGEEGRVEEMCEKLLANPIIEDYRIEND